MPAELDIVAAENRRLVREVKELRARGRHSSRPLARMYRASKLRSTRTSRSSTRRAYASWWSTPSPSCQSFCARDGRFDLICVDGSDLALSVLVDAALLWRLPAPGGVLVFENYLSRSPLGEDPLFDPAPAVDAFRDLVRGHCELLVEANELIVRRARTPSMTDVVQAETPAQL